MKARDIMTTGPSCCSPSDSLQDVARTMRDNDCGAVPVVEDGVLIGIVTDRDLAVRALAVGKGASATVDEVVTLDPCSCNTDDDLREVEQVMAENQVRRVPIVDDDGHCVGIVAQADLARAALHGERVTEHEVAIVVERISTARPRPFDRGVQDTFEQTF